MVLANIIIINYYNNFHPIGTILKHLINSGVGEEFTCLIVNSSNFLEALEFRPSKILYKHVKSIVMYRLQI